MTKLCGSCKRTDQDTSFSPGVFNFCKSCNQTYQKKYRFKHKEKLNEKARIKRKLFPEKKYFEELKGRYGIDRAWFENQWKLQDGKCVCGFEFELFSGDRTRSPHLDHCHVTGKARGLLCYKCNTAIGLLDLDSRTLADSFDLLTKLLKYLGKI